MTDEQKRDLFGLTNEEATEMCDALQKIIEGMELSTLPIKIIRLAEKECWSYNKVLAAGSILGKWL